MQVKLSDDSRTRREGFTLIELVLAVGLIGGSFLALLFLRASAVDKAHRFNTQRTVQRVAQEKLDEVVFGIEELQSGEIEGKTGWAWEVYISTLATVESLYPLLECTLTLHYPGEDPDTQEEHQVATRFFADETHPLREFADLEGEG